MYQSIAPYDTLVNEAEGRSYYPPLDSRQNFGRILYTIIKRYIIHSTTSRIISHNIAFVMIELKRISHSGPLGKAGV
jgi:hypothetical protein